MAGGKVYLLGAGPGDPELITARALRRLGEADVVLYDALVHPDLLDRAKPGAERVFVGKRAGRPSERQAEINARMLDAVRAGKTVARLKGGDPFLFGRGSEEAAWLSEHGVPFEVVPGVPSPMAAMAYAGITLTHRDRSSSVVYLTATESAEKDASSHDWAKLSTGPETLVIFMGMRKLPTLMRLLVSHGRSPDTPAAVVQWASLPKQRTVVGTVGDIAEKARAAGLGLPALTIVGDVVELRETLRWYDAQPLFGKRVLVTRPAHQNEELSRMLRDQGAEPICVPAIRILPPDDPTPLADAVAHASRYRWVIFTSTNGVAAFFDEVARQDRDARVLGASRVCAIGPATADALRAHGVRADVMPEEFRGEGAAEAVLAADPDLPGSRVLLPRAAVAREALPEMLRDAGAEVDVVPAYQTVGASEDDAVRLRDLVHRKQVDVLTFTSPSTVREVAAALGDHADAVAEGFTVACIGPVTAEAAAERGWPVHVVPEDYTAPGLLRALVEHFAEEPPVGPASGSDSGCAPNSKGGGEETGRGGECARLRRPRASLFRSRLSSPPTLLASPLLFSALLVLTACGLPEGDTFVYPADAPELAQQNDCAEGVWESAPLPGGDVEPAWLPYPPRATIQVEHCLGRAPIEPQVYLSFDRNGTESVLAAGDLARFIAADASTLTIKNETSAMFFARIVAR